jgi:hypothetical protein
MQVVIQTATKNISAMLSATCNFREFAYFAEDVFRLEQQEERKKGRNSNFAT